MINDFVAIALSHGRLIKVSEALPTVHCILVCTWGLIIGS